MDNDEQLTLDFIESEIQAEQKGTAPQSVAEESTAQQNKVSRKPFHITDFDTPHDKEMAVFTHAKKLSEYIFVITERSPKKLRWSIITRLQNASVDVIECLYRANYERDGDRRAEFQKQAMVNLSIVDFFAETARCKQAINLRQTAIISKQLVEVKKLLTGWVRSTNRKQYG